jgi:hypothetical protein
LRALYAEFWNDKEVSQVRRWIISDRLYKDVLQPVLILRNSDGRDLNEGAVTILDNVDKFLSLLIRLKTLEEGIANRRRKSINHLLFAEYWRPPAESRQELRDYIENEWPEYGKLGEMCSTKGYKRR